MTAMAAKEEKIDHAFYEELQSQLKEALNAKKVADKALSSVEDQIEKFEVSYLTETSASGNVVKGFENYLRAQARPHRRVGESDIESQRIFSRSSITYLKKVIPDNTSLDEPSPSPTGTGPRKKGTKRKSTSAAQSEDDSVGGEDTPTAPKRIRATMKLDSGS